MYYVVDKDRMVITHKVRTQEDADMFADLEVDANTATLKDSDEECVGNMFSDAKLQMLLGNTTGAEQLGRGLWLRSALQAVMKALPATDYDSSKLRKLWHETAEKAELRYVYNHEARIVEREEACEPLRVLNFDFSGVTVQKVMDTVPTKVENKSSTEQRKPSSAASPTKAIREWLTKAYEAQGRPADIAAFRKAECAKLRESGLYNSSTISVQASIWVKEHQQ